MKKLIYIALAVLMVLLCACSRYADRTIDNPQFETTNAGSGLNFTRILTSDSTTVLEGYIKFRPGWWVRLAESTCLKADGKKYRILKADSITLGDTLWMPENGILNFRLTFEPVPASAKKVDFTEDTEDGWIVWGIDLTGKADYRAIPENLPAEFQAEMPFLTVPEPDFGCDSATVNVHLLGYHPEMGSKFGYIINSIRPQNAEQEGLKIDSLGNGTVKVRLYGPSEFIVFNGGSAKVNVPYSSMLLSPGETADLYIDLRRIGQIFHTPDDAEMEPYVSTWSSGRYAAQEAAMRKIEYHTMFNPYSGDFMPVDVDGAQFASLLKEKLQAARDSISVLDAPDAAKEVMNLAEEAAYLDCIANAEYIAEQQYRAATQTWRGPIPADAVKLEMTPELTARMAKEVRDINDPRLLTSMRYTGESPYDLVSPIWKEALGADALLSELTVASDMMDKIDHNGLTDEDRASIAALSRPWLRQIVETREADVKTEKSRIDLSLISETPNVPNDKLFDAIVAPYKGKVVMVDLWNTWCGPCRAALSHNEPEKSGDLSSDDIVWIYIADESSPLPTYGKMIPDIKGIHYRVSEEQIGAIRKRFNVDGIPYYILVDREGKATGGPDLRDHTLFKKTLLEEIAR